jgi:hypothetical protein
MPLSLLFLYIVRWPDESEKIRKEAAIDSEIISAFVWRYRGTPGRL